MEVLVPAITAKRNPIRAARTKAGITQFELAHRAGCSLAAVQLLEHGWSPDPARSRVLRAVTDTLTALNGERPA